MGEWTRSIGSGSVVAIACSRRLHRRKHEAEAGGQIEDDEYMRLLRSIRRTPLMDESITMTSVPALEYLLLLSLALLNIMFRFLHMEWQRPKSISPVNMRVSGRLLRTFSMHIRSLWMRK
ncbi:hypothetical protein VTP01DRAFT_5445 [Rhizomucor pusillus]|uniref:uncharacterized protein n=1 Tax=Rhizomucor pusillus TaxID=4840 RepID=UPI00374232C1